MSLSVLTLYRNHIDKIVQILIGLVVLATVIGPHGSQLPALLLVIICLPLCFYRDEGRFEASHWWVLMMILPLLVSLPLFMSSKSGEALDAPSRYLVAAVVFLALRYFSVQASMILRAASLSSIVAVILNIHQLDTSRLDFGVGIMESAYLSALLFSLSFRSILLETTTFWRAVAVLGVICAVMVIVISGTRGAWISLIAVLIINLMTLPVSFNKKAILTIVISISMVILIQTSPYVSNRLDKTINNVKLYSSGENRRTSTGLRLDLWIMSWQSFVKSPVWGLDYEKRSIVMKEYKEKNPTSFIGHDGRSSSHNEVLHALSQKGMLGLLSVSLLYAVPFIFFWKKLKAPKNNITYNLSIAGISIVVSMMLSGLTEAPLMHVRVSTSYIFLLVFMYYAVLYSEAKELKNYSI